MPPLKDKPIHDMKIAERAHFFRKKYIDKTLIRAAEKLGVSASWLSQVENGKRSCSGVLVMKMVSNYGLNTDWLSSGKGDPKMEPGKHTAASSLTAAFKEIEVIQRAFKITTANLSHALKLIDTQNKRIDDLQRRMDKLEDGK